MLVDQSASPLLVRLNRELTEVEGESDEALGERLGRNADMLHALALQLRAIAPRSVHTELTAADEARGIEEDLLAGLPRELVEGPEAVEDALVSSG